MSSADDARLGASDDEFSSLLSRHNRNFLGRSPEQDLPDDPCRVYQKSLTRASSDGTPEAESLNLPARHGEIQRKKPVSLEVRLTQALRPTAAVAGRDIFRE